MVSEKEHSVRVIIVDQINDLDIYEEGWNQLLENCQGACPSQSYSWIKAFFRYILDNSEKWICLFALKSNKEIFGIYPLICRDKKGITGFYFQTFQTPYHGLNTTRADGLILDGYEFVLELFVQKLRKTFNVFPIIHAIDIPDFSSSMRSSMKSNKKNSFIIKFAGTENFLSIKGNNFENYFRELKPSYKKNLNRYARRLAGINTISYIFNTYTSNIEDHYKKFVDIEDSGWKGKKGTSIKKNSGDYMLFKQCSEDFIKKDSMFINFLLINEKAIATQLCFKINRVLYMWKSAYLEEYSEYSPGNLLRINLIKYCFDSGHIDELNFISNRKQFKDLNVSKREIYKLIFFPKVFLLSAFLKFYYKLKFYYFNKRNKWFN